MSAEALPDKEGIYERNDVLYIVGAKYIARIANALASETRAKILDMLLEGPADLDDIAREVGQSKANISSQIKKLESVGIIKARYLPGQRGIKKVVELNIKKIVFILERPGRRRESRS